MNILGLTRPSEEVIRRHRHPRALPIKRVAWNGQPLKDFDPAQEIIRLPAAAGVV